MKLSASLVIKHHGSQVTANTCIGGQSLLCSGAAGSVPEAVGRATDSRYQYRNVLVACDFTRSLSPEQALDVMYVQIHPLFCAQSESAPSLRHENGLTSKVISFSLIYDFEKGIVNSGDLFGLIERTKPRCVAINTPYAISEYHAENHLYDELTARYPHIDVYPSRHLMNKDFITRGNTLLLNMLISPRIERYAADLKKALAAHGISAPVFFLRNTGMAGEHTLAHLGMDTYHSETLAFLHDVLSLHPHDYMYIADWQSESLYYVHQGCPQMIKMPIDYNSTKIYGHIPVCYSLQGVCSCGQLLELLGAHNPLPGTVPLISVGDSPFHIHSLFEYPAVCIPFDSLDCQCGISRVGYFLEMEAYEYGAHTEKTARMITQTLSRQAEKDCIPLSAMRIALERLPMKYLNDDKYIIHGTLKAGLGDAHEADD